MPEPSYLAPNVIVFERLKADFEGGRIFRLDPLIPNQLKISWEFDCVMRGDAERAPAEGMLFLTNIQQLYDRLERKKNGDDELDIMTEVLGPKPKDDLHSDLTGFTDVLSKRPGRLLISQRRSARYARRRKRVEQGHSPGLHTDIPLAARLDSPPRPALAKVACFPG